MSRAEDPLVCCPLDKVHRIRTSRLQFHLVRCLQNYKLSSINKVKCPFNPLHIVESVEIMHHCKTCPDSALVVLEQYDLEGEKCFSGDIPFEEVQRQYNESIPENYQCEKYTRNAPGYDPTANIENRAVLRTLSGVSKSKRREFRQRERERFALLDQNNLFVAQASATTELSEIEKPLRQPHHISHNLANIVDNTKADANKNISTQKDDKVEADKMKLRTTESQTLKLEKNINPPPIKNRNNTDVVSQTLEILSDDGTESVSDALNQLSVLDKVENVIKERKSKLMSLISSSNGVTPTADKVSYRDAALSKSSSDSDTAVGMNPSRVIRNRKCAANFNMTGGETAAAGSSSKMRLPRTNDKQ